MKTILSFASLLFCTTLYSADAPIIEQPQEPPRLLSLNVEPNWTTAQRQAAYTRPDYGFFAPFSFTAGVSDLLDRDDGHLRVVDFDLTASSQAASGDPCRGLESRGRSLLVDCWESMSFDSLFADVPILVGDVELVRPNHLTGNLLFPEDSLGFPKRGWLFKAVVTDEDGAKTTTIDFFTVVPEPCPLLPFLAGMVSLGRVRRR